ncbi:uncharacterized protein Z520_02817 [Fonsecaea multimorphosa CBS 102226]|uniref:Carboxymuconolactone decarboxylase-like domain-containing protein n=1 Tax=Fonsecaea multimorphosa CBS 102226 TaxID=1442371 RepID=A0A0D2KDG2_9EURO|nr:uncharacterized protein Z520_02817 [Fonsecaea multimorphosa CBS 102226]KIY01265.1 hypothetical protein Z520_02817 [Fonsecaea multimorphosa CBS 102226]
MEYLDRHKVPLLLTQAYRKKKSTPTPPGPRKSATRAISKEEPREVKGILTRSGADPKKEKPNEFGLPNTTPIPVRHLNLMRVVFPAEFWGLTGLLNIKANYEMWMSEDSILSWTETQLCNVALLICNNSPVQAGWHMNGTLRHGASRDQIQFSRDLALAVARQFNAKTGDIPRVEDLKV